VEIDVLNRQRAVRIDPDRLAAFARRAAEALPPPDASGMSVCLVSDRAMSVFNRRYRARRGTTDVLSFRGDGRAGPDGRTHLGDIVISVERARTQARAEGHSLGRELRILLLHGYLHLLGYDHESDDGTMMRTQRRLLGRLLARGGR
jgi:probable rRNA maturation factor